MDNNQKKSSEMPVHQEQQIQARPASTAACWTLETKQHGMRASACAQLRSNGSFSPFSSGSIAFQLPRQ
jgi:hypothetical protein